MSIKTFLKGKIPKPNLQSNNTNDNTNNDKNSKNFYEKIGISYSNSERNNDGKINQISNINKDQIQNHKINNEINENNKKKFEVKIDSNKYFNYKIRNLESMRFLKFTQVSTGQNKEIKQYNLSLYKKCLDVIQSQDNTQLVFCINSNLEFLGIYKISMSSDEKAIFKKVFSHIQDIPNMFTENRVCSFLALSSDKYKCEGLYVLKNNFDISNVSAVVLY